MHTFACTIGSFINDDWEIIQHVIDFHPLECNEHEGVHAAKAFVNGAVQCGGLNKICISCLDLILSRCLSVFLTLLA